MTSTTADLFFVISSVGFIVLFVMTAIFMYYATRAVRKINGLTEKIEKNIDSVGYAGKELIEEMRNSVAFRLLFRGRKK